MNRPEKFRADTLDLLARPAGPWPPGWRAAGTRHHQQQRWWLQAGNRRTKKDEEGRGTPAATRSPDRSAAIGTNPTTVTTVMRTSSVHGRSQS